MSNNKTFYTPYDEEFARECIQYCFPFLGWNLHLNEPNSPDLIDYTNSVGVEVTRVSKQDDYELNALFSKYTGYEEKDIPKGVMKKVNRGRKRFLFFDMTNSGRETLQACSHDVRELNYIDIVNAIEKKTIKLNDTNSAYYPCELYALFIYDTDSFLFEKGIPYIIDNANEAVDESQLHYQFIIVFCYHDIHLIERESGYVKSRKMSDSEIEMIRTNTLKTLGRIDCFRRIQ